MSKLSTKNNWNTIQAFNKSRKLSGENKKRIFSIFIIFQESAYNMIYS